MKRESKWSKYYTLVSIACATLVTLVNIVIFAISSNIKAYHDNLLLNLQIKKLELEKSNIEKNNYKSDYQQIKKITKIVSDLQATVTEETKVCHGDSMFNYYNDADKRSTIASLQKARFELSKQFVAESTILNHISGYNVTQAARNFIQMLNRYPNPCVSNIPTEAAWIEAEGKLISSLIDKLKAKYPQSFYQNQF